MIEKKTITSQHNFRFLGPSSNSDKCSNYVDIPYYMIHQKFNLDTLTS